jgi:DNA-binding transcriptional regulator YdaS (Cro superfamily)
METKRDEALERAIEMVGGTSALGRYLGISQSAVWQWRRCPAERVLAIVQATGCKITCHELRPDIYPRSMSV